MFRDLNHPSADFNANTAAGTQLIYYGGPVISHAKVYSVFWGNRVNQTTRTQVGGMLAAAVNSTYMDWLSIYNTNITAVDGRQGTSQAIGRGVFMGDIDIAPRFASNRIDNNDIMVELETQIDIGALPRPDENTLYMIFFPPGHTITVEGSSSCSSFCAYHEGFVSKKYGAIFYGVMPDLGGACSWGCGGSGFDAMTFVTSHELIEAVTDPFPTPGNQPAYPQAWNTTDGSEIADLCMSRAQLSAGNRNYALSQLWDNRIGRCAPGPYTTK
jgi:hypothetical protein